MVYVRGGGRSFGGGGGRRHQDSFFLHKSGLTSVGTSAQEPKVRALVQFERGDILMDSDSRCISAMRSLQSTLRHRDNKLYLGNAVYYNECLVNCPDIPDLRKLSEHDDIPAMKKTNCAFLLEQRTKLLSQQYQELSASQHAFFKSWLDSCPDDD